MCTESTFRLLFSLTFGVVIIIWLRNLLRVGLSSRMFYTPTEGLFVGVPLRVLLISSMASVIVYIVSPRWLGWATISAAPCLRWLGLPVGIASAVLLIRIFRALGHNFSMSLNIKERQTLATNGPYRRVRHPMYTALFMFWLSLFILSANWFIGLTGLLGQALIMLVRTPKEERMMLEQFGDSYAAYMQRTGRFLPRRR
jgi:protein-S-isoprenylcysteine O-methyltransferase Ste14